MNKSLTLAAALLSCAPFSRAAAPAAFFEGNAPAPNFATAAGPRTDLSARLNVGDRFKAVRCSCSSTEGLGPVSGSAACAPRNAEASVFPYRDADDKTGTLLALDNISDFGNFVLPENEGFARPILNRPMPQGSEPFENWSRLPLEVPPSPFGASKSYSDVLAISYLRSWNDDATALAQTDETEFRMEKAGIVYEKSVSATTFRALGGNRYAADLEISVKGVDALAPAELAILKDSGVYSLNGMYEADRQVSRRYRISCLLEKE